MPARLPGQQRPAVSQVGFLDELRRYGQGAQQAWTNFNDIEMSLQDLNRGIIDAYRGETDKGEVIPGIMRFMELAPVVPGVPAGAFGAGMRLTKDAVPGLDKLWRHLTKAEQYELTPATAKTMVSTADELPSAKELASVAHAGRAHFGWYKNSSKAIIDTFGEDTPRFTALLAGLSPRVGVEENLKNALNIWNRWTKAGRPDNPDRLLEIMAEGIQGEKGVDSVMEAWRANSIDALRTKDPLNFRLSGGKVQSFKGNLLQDLQEVTNDAWMGAGMGKGGYTANKKFAGQLGLDIKDPLASRRVKEPAFDPGGEAILDEDGKPVMRMVGLKSGGYMAFNARMREAAKIYSRRIGEEVDPANMQETIWALTKRLYEKSQNPGYYRWDTYQQDMDRYERLVDRYSELGDELNTVYQRMRS